MSRKNRNLKYNPKLAHKEKIRDLKSSKFGGKKDFRGGNKERFGNNGNKNFNNNNKFGGNRGGNFKKSGFNRSERPSKDNRNRPGKVQRLKDRNKKKSFKH